VVCDLLQLGVKKGGGEYIAKDNAHLKTRGCGPKGVQIMFCNKSTNPPRERNHKIVQFKSLFHILTHGDLMLEYETKHELFVSLNPT